MLAALRLLTVVPAGPRDGRLATASFVWFPLVGLLVGAVWALPGLLIGVRFPSAGVPAATVLIVDALVTRGLHLRAAADVADRAAADAGRAAGALGVAGALTVVLASLLRYGALTFSADFGYRLFAAPVAGRAAMVLLAWRAAGVGAAVSPPMAAAVAAVTLAAVVPSGPRGVTALGVALLVAGAYALWHRWRLGELDMAGSAAGALLAETAALLALSAR